MQAKRYSNNLNRIRKNTIVRRRKLFENGIRRSKPSGNRFNGPDEDYGMAEPIEDNLDDLNEKNTEFLKKLSKVDRNELQLRTVEQSHNQEWHNERKKRLTASNFGDICKMRANTSCRKKVYSLLYRPNFLSKEMMHGVEMESLARNSFEELTRKTVQLCGLFTDNEFPYLAASPGNTS